MRRRLFIVTLLGALVSSAVAVAASNTTITTHSTRRGRILSTSRGFSLYMHANDKQGGKSKAPKSTCNRRCAKTWRPLLIKEDGEGVSSGGVKQKLLGTVRRTDGSTQVTYNGWPLYTNKSDPGAGTITGETVAQFGGRWYLLTSKGQEVRGCLPSDRLTPTGCLTRTY